MKKLLILILLLLSAGVFGQSKKHPNTLSMSHISMGWFQNSKPEVSVRMSIAKDSSIVIIGDTIKVVRMLLKYLEDCQKQKEAADELLTFYQVDDNRAKHYTAYRNALIQYWKLKNDKRYKTIKK